jgi:hypothetical protein
VLEQHLNHATVAIEACDSHGVKVFGTRVDCRILEKKCGKCGMPILGGQLDGTIVEGVGMDSLIRNHQAYDLTEASIDGHKERQAIARDGVASAVAQQCFHDCNQAPVASNLQRTVELAW